MLKTLYLIPCLLCSVAAWSQITLSTSYFPGAGDTLTYGVSDSTYTVDLLTPGPDRDWDFGSPAAVRQRQQIATAVGEDTTFAGADLIFDVDQNTKGYYRVTDTVFQLIGLRGNNELLAGVDLSAPVDPPRAERRAPLNYQDAFTTNTVNRIEVPVDSLPAEITEQFGGLLPSDGVVQITATSTRSDLVDAYGSLAINERTYPVLREKRTEQVTTTVKVTTAVGLLDITGTLAQQEPELADFLGEADPIVTYYYWAEGEKEAIAIVTADENEVAEGGISFILTDQTNSSNSVRLARAQVQVYPNPANSLATFEVDGLETGSYTLRLVNVLGREVHREIVVAVGGRSRTEVDVSRLPRGTYLYSLTNERGLLLTTRRLLVGY
jgi:hypothetical protein